MTVPIGMQASADARCWQCGGPANPKSAYSVLLVADGRRNLEAFDYPVVHGTRYDKLRVGVPRCTRCQSRTRLSNLTVLSGALAGAIVAPVFRSLFGLHIEPPRRLEVGYGSEGIFGATAAVGLVVGL